MLSMWLQLRFTLVFCVLYVCRCFTGRLGVYHLPHLQAARISPRRDPLLLPHRRTRPPGAPLPSPCSVSLRREPERNGLGHTSLLLTGTGTMYAPVHTTIHIYNMVKGEKRCPLTIPLKTKKIGLHPHYVKK